MGVRRALHSDCSWSYPIKETTMMVIALSVVVFVVLDAAFVTCRSICSSVGYYDGFGCAVGGCATERKNDRILCLLREQDQTKREVLCRWSIPHTKY